jgi:hypothetical protein
MHAQKTSSNIRNMEYVFDLSKPYKRRIEKVLDLLNREFIPNFEAIVVRAGRGRITLSHRFCGIIISRIELNSKIRQCLTNA